MVLVNPSAPVGVCDVKPAPTGQIVVDFMKAGAWWRTVETGMNLDRRGCRWPGGHLHGPWNAGSVGERYILGCGAI